MKTTRSLICTSTLTALLAACSSGGLSHRIESDDLDGVPEARQAELERLAESVETAKAEKAKAEKDLALAEYELEKAEKNLELVKDRIDHMEGLEDAAETLGDESRVKDAQAVLEGLTALRDAHEEQVEWLEAEVDYYEIGIELAQAKIDAEDAQLMEARAAAVHEADLPNKGEYPLEDYKIQVSEKMAATAGLAAKSARAWKEIQEEKQEFQEALAKVPEDDAAATKAELAEKNKNSEVADEMNALRKQIDRLRKDNERLQTTLAGQEAGGGDAPALNPGGGAVKAGSDSGDGSDDD